MRRAVKANAKQHFIRLFHFFIRSIKSAAQHFQPSSDNCQWTRCNTTFLFPAREELSRYIHKPRRGVFGPWHCLLGGQVSHSQRSQLGQTHSEAWGSDPGCGLRDASLRSAEGLTWSLDSVNNGRDTWVLRRSWWLRSNFKGNKTVSHCHRNHCGRQFLQSSPQKCPPLPILTLMSGHMTEHLSSGDHNLSRLAPLYLNPSFHSSTTRSLFSWVLCDNINLQRHMLTGEKKNSTIIMGEGL